MQTTSQNDLQGLKALAPSLAGRCVLTSRNQQPSVQGPAHIVLYPGFSSMRLNTQGSHALCLSHFTTPLPTKTGNQIKPVVPAQRCEHLPMSFSTQPKLLVFPTWEHTCGPCWHVCHIRVLMPLYPSTLKTHLWPLLARMAHTRPARTAPTCPCAP